MEHTTNYNLPQWAEPDRIKMEDFNQMCADIDQGVKAAKDAADAAQATADAAYCPNNKPYTVGSYTGTGGGMTITLGFRPSFLIISGSRTSYPTGIDYFGAYDVFTGGTILTETVTFTDTGFVLNYRESNEYPQLIQSGRQYNYIAFR